MWVCENVEILECGRMRMWACVQVCGIAEMSDQQQAHVYAFMRFCVSVCLHLDLTMDL